MIQLGIQSQSLTKNPTPTSSVLRNPTPTPTKNLSDSLRLRLRKPDLTSPFSMQCISITSSNVVEIVTSETETWLWLKLRNGDFAIKTETETWKFENKTETRDQVMESRDLVRASTFNC